MARPGRSTGAPCPLWTPRRPTFHPAVSLHTIKPWTRHSRGAKVWHLPHNYLPTRSKPVHTLEIQAGPHNGDPKPVHTMEIQSRFTQWRSKPVHTTEIQSRFTQRRSKAGSLKWRFKPVPTMEIQSPFTQWRSKAGSHNGDPKPVHTMEIQAGSHNGDPKPVHTMEIQAGSHNGDPSRFTQWRSKLAAVTIGPDTQSLEAELPMSYTFVWLPGLNHPPMQHNTSPHTSTWGTWYNAPRGIIGSFTCTRRVYRFQAQAIN